MSGFGISIYLPKKLNDDLSSKLEKFFEDEYHATQNLKFKNRKRIKERILNGRWEILFETNNIVIIEYEIINNNFPFDEETEFEYLQIKEYLGNFPEGILNVTSGINISRKFPNETYNLISKLTELTKGFVNIQSGLSYFVNKPENSENIDTINEIFNSIKNLKGQKMEIVSYSIQETQVHHLLDYEFLKEWKKDKNFYYLF
ncbi:MAG: DUF6368 family protein [Candidatus Sericytochromatia bacterium]